YPLFWPPDDRRKRDDSEPDVAHLAPPPRAPRRARGAARRRLAAELGRRGGPPFQPARDVLPPHDEGRYGAPRGAHPAGVVRRRLLSLRQSRRRPVPRARSLRHHTEPERAPRVRRRRALLPRGEPGTPPATVHDRGDAAALPEDHARRRDRPPPVALHRRREAHAGQARGLAV